MTKSVAEHEGRKYLRVIRDALTGDSVRVDVYAVLKAFLVTCPARAHCIKKLLTAGQRGKGSELDDLVGAEAALSRAIDLQRLEDEVVTGTACRARGRAEGRGAEGPDEGLPNSDQVVS